MFLLVALVLLAVLAGPVVTEHVEGQEEEGQVERTVEEESQLVILHWIRLIL